MTISSPQSFDDSDTVDMVGSAGRRLSKTVLSDPARHAESGTVFDTESSESIRRGVPVRASGNFQDDFWIATKGWDESHDDVQAPSPSQPCLDLLHSFDQDAPGPIEKLPTELIQRVFLYVLPLLPYPCLPQVLIDFEELDDEAQHINLARLRLTHVCRTWKALVQSATYLWTKIAIDGPFPQDFVVVEQWFANSGARLLDISFDARILDARLIQLLRQNIGRIRCLVSSSPVMKPSLLQTLFPIETTTEAPALEALRVHCGESHGPIGRIHAPSLVHLHQDAVGSTYAYLTPTPSLRSYTGSSYSLPFAVQCAQITDLQVHLHQSLPSDIGRVVLQTVRSLILIPCHGLLHDPILHFVRQVDVPSLTSLEVWMNGSRGSVTCEDLLKVIADRYGCSLRHLEVGCAKFNGRFGKDNFFKMPLLQSLAFRFSTLGEHLYHALMPEQFSGPWPCPDLSKLCITNSAIRPRFVLDRLIHRRAVWNYPRGHHTRYLTLCLEGCNVSTSIDDLQALTKTHNFILEYRP